MAEASPNTLSISSNESSAVEACARLFLSAVPDRDEAAAAATALGDVADAARGCGAWSVPSSTDGITVDSRPCKGKPRQVRGRVRLPCPVLQAVDEYWQFDTRFQWDPSVDAARVHVLEQSQDGCKRLLQSSSEPVLGGLIKSREFLDLVFKYEFVPGSEFAVLAAGVERAEHPLAKGGVRGVSYGSGAYFRAASPTETELTLIVCSDAGGWIPRSAVEQATASIVRDIASCFRSRVLSLADQ